MPEWNEAAHPRDDDGKFGNGGGKSGAQGSGADLTALVPEKTASVKSARAKAAHVMVDKTIQRYSEEHNEPRIAAAIGGESYNDSEPVDVGIKKGGKVAHGIEIKTMVISSNNKITMKRSAMEKKKAWEETTGGVYHTVVLDDHDVFNALGEGQHDESKRVIYYKRGAGSFRVDGMQRVGSMKELKKLMETPDVQLPKAAQPTSYWLKMKGVAGKRMSKVV